MEEKRDVRLFKMEKDKLPLCFKLLDKLGYRWSDSAPMKVYEQGFISYDFPDPVLEVEKWKDYKFISGMSEGVIKKNIEAGFKTEEPLYSYEEFLDFVGISQEMIESNDIFQVPLGIDIDNPEFENTGHVHDWRNYVRDEFQEAWDELTERERRIIAIMAEDRSSIEEWD